MFFLFQKWLLIHTPLLELMRTWLKDLPLLFRCLLRDLPLLFKCMWTIVKNLRCSMGWISRGDKKSFFFLTTLNFTRFLAEDIPKLNESEIDMQVINIVDAWKHFDFLCRNCVMNGLHDSLYNVYCSMKTTKELWESLDQKHKIEVIEAKKFMVDRFLNFKMMDYKL